MAVRRLGPTRFGMPGSADFVLTCCSTAGAKQLPALCDNKSTGSLRTFSLSSDRRLTVSEARFGRRGKYGSHMSAICTGFCLGEVAVACIAIADPAYPLD